MLHICNVLQIVHNIWYKIYSLFTVSHRGISNHEWSKKKETYLGVVWIQRSGHETFRLFQISQSVSERTASATEIAGWCAAIHQLLYAQRYQLAGVLKNLSLNTFGNGVSIATPAVQLIYWRSYKAVFSPIHAFWYVTWIMQNRRYQMIR